MGFGLLTSAASEKMVRLALTALLLLVLLMSPTAKASDVPCTSDEFCQEMLRDGSQCVDGTCTNPFYHGGCLKSVVEDWAKVRVCTSHDPPEALENGYCRMSPFGYMEVRVLAQDWDTAFFSSWILQIVLSEMLDIPVSLEVGNPTLNTDFYNRDNSLDYGSFMPSYQELATGSRVGDCRSIWTDSVEEYQSCAHIAPEAWRVAESDVERPRPLGALGNSHFWVPKFTAENDTSLLSYIGLSGAENRRKLAQTFKRPTTWKEYCDEISTNSCEEDDGIAKRPPANEGEDQSYFAGGLYTGHFRYTDENDCDTNPDTCTGHAAGYPCHWVGYYLQQVHHLGVALQSDGPSANGGYSYSQLNQIWHAANATREHVMLEWWNPETLYSTYIGTEAEFTRVVLPPPTQKCVDARAPHTTFCGDDYEAKIGSAEGACDADAARINKWISKTFYPLTHDPEISEALWSPAHAVLANMQVNNLQYDQMLQYWLERGVDSRYDRRDAVCRWVTENMDLVQSWIPETYPRIIQDRGEVTKSSTKKAAQALAVIAMSLVMASFVITYQKRNTKAMYYAQKEFLLLLLYGMLLWGMGALLQSLPPSNTTCALMPWFINLGYVLHLVPLYLRVQEINRLHSSGKSMLRLLLRKGQLARALIVGFFIIGTFLIIWTAMDKPEKILLYKTSEIVTDDGDTVVLTADSCGSESDVWIYIAISWRLFLAFTGLLLAMVASRFKDDLNDTKALAFVLGVHVILFCIQLFVLIESDENNGQMLLHNSLILSVDALVALFVYVAPKFRNSTGEIVDQEILPDLFLDTTIMLADVQGFVAWSSVREPVAVFQFLEALYESFDEIADRRNIFKVETSGESYVAASGIPDQRSDHAVVMAKFAFDCIKKMEKLCKKLEIRFGPDTSDLTLRVGIHSGPVTGGFMKGKKSRFQLFGDTMSTASIIHETGDSNMIHISETTANLLIEAGKKKWVQQRVNKIRTVEKGELQTFWISRGSMGASPGGSVAGTNMSENVSEDDDDVYGLDSEQRWIEWNIDILRRQLKKIVVTHNHHHHLPRESSHHGESPTDDGGDDALMPLEEVEEIIELPEFDKAAAKKLLDMDEEAVDLPSGVEDQLRDYVTQIASLYEKNPFHNFAHASYVVMAVVKYMNRIIAASEIDHGIDEQRQRTSTQEAIHDHTFGIASDPLTQFACVFAALIHEAHHPGVPNNTFVQENKRLASIYQNRSVAEQRSFDLSWDMFMEHGFSLLRKTVCPNNSELRRFRKLVINGVMAMDFGDQQLKELRNQRWAKAFSESARSNEASPRELTNRKATIVIEHLLQAADIAHTCQHWGIYRKWNQKLFEECYQAFKDGRAAKNPAEYWYDGEIGFFDFYIIPLAKKLRDCGVFGQTGDENLNYANNNRSMWVEQGKQIVLDMLAQAEAVEAQRAEVLLSEELSSQQLIEQAIPGI